MTAAAQIVMDVIEEGGEIRLEDGRLKVKGVPARLVPVIRERKTELLALLSADEERLAIQSEDDVLPDRGWADVPGFEGMPDLSPAKHGAIRRRLMNAPLQAPAPAESMDDTTTRPPMQHRANLAPQRVSCGQCCRFQPGPQPLSIGRCLATVDGQPPRDQRGYGAAYPMAARSCPEYAGVAS